MTHAPTAARCLVLDELRPVVAKAFAAQPALRSILVAVAQYYADNARDEVHTYLIGSERDVPVWPHGCARWDDFAVAGESCEKCNRPTLAWFSSHYTEMITGFAPYCHERADPEAAYSANYLPYGIFHRNGSFEVVGTVLRGFAELAPEGEPMLPAPIDPRAAELFDIACASRDDDGPRHVLADHLTEQSDPRGEYIALALASSLDADAIARRDALLEQHRAAWMAPLDRVVPAACARFERGLLAEVGVYAADAGVIDQVKTAPAWRSVETLRYLPGSLPLLDHGMTALRDVGPLAGADIVTVATAPRPWAIESLHLSVYDLHDAEARQLLAATNLPRLRALTLSAIDVEWLGLVRTAPWFGQLERLTVLDAYELALPLLARSEFAAIRWFAVAEKQDDRPVGWEIAYCAAEQRFEVRLVGYWEFATRAELASLVARLVPAGSLELVGNRLWQPTDDDVAALSASGRTVTRR